jgi:hypothetical protein
MMIIRSDKKNFNGKCRSNFDNFLLIGHESASTKIVGMPFV